VSTLTKLHDLYDHEGQSPWLDDLKRSYLNEGELARLIDDGVRGVTTNPTIMAKAIEESADYDEQFSTLITGERPIIEIYWELVLKDVRAALGLLRPVFDDSGGADGFVSVEVPPALANDTNATIDAAKSIHERVALSNLLVKIPATEAGVPAIEEMIALGKSINITLIFSLERYAAVIEAYLRGIERFVEAGGDPSTVASVASFFVSRVDTEIDRRLEAIAASEPGSARAEAALGLRGKAALAQAQLAYELFTKAFHSPRALALAARGMRPQRPLWASTSTKNPAYPDLLYVNGLIGPDTVDTMPPATIAAFLDHGVIARTIDRDYDGARAVLDALKPLGIDIGEVSAQLESEGVSSFLKSFDELIARLEEKGAALGAAR
jgi:transaldolase